jgi:hypothetical protein
MITTPPCAVLSTMAKQAMFGNINLETMEMFGEIGDIWRHWRCLETLGDVWRQRKTLQTFGDIGDIRDIGDTREIGDKKMIFVLKGHSVKVGNLTNHMCLLPMHKNLLGDMFLKNLSPSLPNVASEKFLPPHSEKLCQVFLEPF